MEHPIAAVALANWTLNWLVASDIWWYVCWLCQMSNVYLLMWILATGTKWSCFASIYFFLICCHPFTIPIWMRRRQVMHKHYYVVVLLRMQCKTDGVAITTSEFKGVQMVMGKLDGKSDWHCEVLHFVWNSISLMLWEHITLRSDCITDSDDSFSLSIHETLIRIANNWHFFDFGAAHVVLCMFQFPHSDWHYPFLCVCLPF